MQPSLKEQRHLDRIAFDADVLCRASYKPGVIPGKISDLSESGLLLWSSSYFAVGDTINISVLSKAPELHSSDLVATIARIHMLNNSGMVGYGCTYKRAS